MDASATNASDSGLPSEEGGEGVRTERPSFARGDDDARGDVAEGHRGDDDEASTSFWLSDPGVLVRHWAEVVPYGWMSGGRKGNALTRLALLVGVVLLINRLRGGDTSSGIMLVVATLVAVVLAIVLMSRRSQRRRLGGEGDRGLADEGIAPVSWKATGGGGFDPTHHDHGGAPPRHHQQQAPVTFGADHFDMDSRAFRRETSVVRPDPPSQDDMRWIVGGGVDRGHVFDDHHSATVVH